MTVRSAGNMQQVRTATINEITHATDPQGSHRRTKQTCQNGQKRKQLAARRVGKTFQGALLTIVNGWSQLVWLLGGPLT